MPDPNDHTDTALLDIPFRQRILSSSQHIFRWLYDIIRVLKPARFSFFILVLSLVALVTSPGQDLLRSAGERPLSDVLHWLLLGTGICFWASCIWYWARVILRFKHEIDEEGGKKERFHTLRLRTPRWLGTIALAGLTIAVFSAARSYQSTTWFNLGDPAFKLWLLTFGVLLITILFGLFVTFRQRILAALSSLSILPQPIASYLEPLPEALRYSQDADIFSDLSDGTKGVARISLWISFILLFFFSSNEVAVIAAPAFGSLSILFFALGVWSFLGTLLVYLARRTRLPILTLCIAATLVFSLFNDNHKIRTLTQPNTPMQGVVSVNDHSRQWISHRAQADSLAGFSESPVFLVAAEGGGVRAAYWTAIVLSTLQDSIESKTAGTVRFSDHVYAISGASGGSIGAGVFTALVAEELDRGPSFRSENASYFRYTQHLLEGDFLSPIFAKLVVSDLVQRVLPVPIHALDRGAALERSFEKAWTSQFGNSHRFETSFASLWTNHPFQVPSLIVNATHVESGRRMLTTNLPVDRTFADALDLRFEVENEMRLSTALHNGARFPYVNPAGTIRNHNRWLGRIRGRVVDGGYFDNSGATSLKELYNVLEDEGLRDRIHVIWISNSPLNTTPGDTSLVEPGFFRRGFYETFTPPVTILNTRDARARQAVNDLGSTVGNHRLFTFALCKQMADANYRKAALPLSWDLSEQAMNDMTEQLRKGCQFSNNPETLEKIVDLF